MKLLFLMLILSSSVNASPQVPSEFNPKYFSNHTKNIWLFPDWPFYKPTGISKGSEVHVSNDNFTTYKQGKFWSGTVDWDYQLVNVNGFDMPTNYRGWPTYRIDTDILNSYTYIRLADGSTPVEPPPVIEEPEPPVVEEPEPPVIEEPEPPVIEEPEPPVVEEPEPDLNPHPEAEYIQCAWENNTCTLPENAVATIRYGNTVFTYMEGLSGDVQCSNSVFGDPEFGVGKRCAYYVTESIPPVIEEPEPPVIVEPEPPVIEEPEPPVIVEPEPPVIEEPEPPVIVEPEPIPANKCLVTQTEMSWQKLDGPLNRLRNLMIVRPSAFGTAQRIQEDADELRPVIDELRRIAIELARCDK